MERLTPEVLDKWVEKDPKGVILLYNSLFNNQRILEGKSTQAYSGVHDMIRAVKEINELRTANPGAYAEVIDAEFVEEGKGGEDEVKG